jgi:hypothetical protein
MKILFFCILLSIISCSRQNKKADFYGVFEEGTENHCIGFYISLYPAGNFDITRIEDCCMKDCDLQLEYTLAMGLYYVDKKFIYLNDTMKHHTLRLRIVDENTIQNLDTGLFQQNTLFCLRGSYYLNGENKGFGFSEIDSSCNCCKKDGIWVYYDSLESGKHIKQETYVKDSLISTEIFR